MKKASQTKGITPIVTGRVFIRPIQAEDAPMVFNAVTESWDELAPWQIWTLAPRDNITIDHYKKFCVKKAAAYKARTDMTFLVFCRETSQLLGGCGLHDLNWDAGSMSLGFWIRTSETKKGYASEVVNAMVAFAKDQLYVSRLEAMYQTGNEISQKILEKAGFIPARLSQGDPRLYKRHDEYHYMTLAHS